MICPLCDQPITSSLLTGRVDGQVVHSDCCLDEWLAGRKVDQLPAEPLQSTRKEQQATRM